MPTAKRVYTGTLVHTVAYSLKFPEASQFATDVTASIAQVQRSKHKLRVLILDMTAVEYVDFSGVQALFGIKDILAKVANGDGEIQLHFANARTTHMNRLLRVVSYSPKTPQAAASKTAHKPELSPPALPQRAPSSPPPLLLDRMQSPVDSEISYEDAFAARLRSPAPSRRNSGKENVSVRGTQARGRRPSLKEIVVAIGRSLSIGVKSGDGRRSLPEPLNSGGRSRTPATPESKRPAPSLKPSVSNVSLASACSGNVTSGPNQDYALQHFHATVEDAVLAVSSRRC
ncbi:hypothetical protein HDU83_004648 [Entophlyctis luteolus]|nr:hypothetical protein HDU83_004648 [Entophlyctis luteolus]